MSRPFILPRVKSPRWFIFHPHSYGIATLMRIGVRLPSGRKLLVHHFRPHAERDFHDHPWPFRTLVVWGGYVDESLQPSAAATGHADHPIVVDRLGWLSMRKRPALHAHRTSCTRHTVTVVLTGSPERDWCQGQPPERWICEGDQQDFLATRGMAHHA